MPSCTLACRRRCAPLAALAWGALVLSACAGPSPLLVERTVDWGLDVRHHSGDQDRKWLPTIMGGGIALFDADGDDDLDLYVVNGNDHLLEDRDDGPITNRFLRQDAGVFVDATEASGLGDARYGLGVAVGDVDNDGRPDVYVTNFGADQLYRNLGDGRFENATERAGIDVQGHSASATFCDYDRDGWLDLFVTRYLDFDPDMQCFDPAGRRDFCGPQSFDPVSSVLLRNSGDGRFEDVSVASGIDAHPSTGLGVVCEDVDDDGWPDFYVANDGYANYLWINQRDGRFEERAIPLGVAYNRTGDAEAGMGVLAADLDGDARSDLFVTHLHNETNTFYRGLDTGLGFEDATNDSGLGVPSLLYTGFGTVPIDLDLDGDLDLAIANGRVRSHSEALPGADVPAPWDRLAEPSQVLVNRGDGTFEALAADRCGFCERVEVGRGLAVGDVDRDGDLDLVKTSIEGPARLYLDEGEAHGQWLRVRAIDPELGRDAIGARLELQVGASRRLHVISSGLSYMSASEPVAHFGLGEETEIGPIDVLWPSGDLTRESFEVDCVDCAITIRRGEGRPLP